MNPPALRTAILSKKLLQSTPYASAFNKGIDTAIDIVDAHARDHVASIAAGHERNRAAGRHVAGGVPYGYQVATDGQLLEQPTEQSTIATVRELRALHQWSWRRISASLLARNIKSRTDRRFAPAQLRRMMRDPAIARPSDAVGTAAPVSTPSPVKPVSGERRATKSPARRKRSRR